MPGIVLGIWDTKMNNKKDTNKPLSQRARILKGRQIIKMINK